jgi:3-phenylpropionate/trans-cinnamate dioxygenase ferredoxin subunit
LKTSIPRPALAAGQSMVVTIGEIPVLLCRSATGLHAMRDRCPHQDKSLEGARIRGPNLFCPHHGARFNLEDGRSLSPLTTKALELLPCAAAGDHLEIET